MYVPSHFAMSGPPEMLQFIRTHSFGVLVSVIDGAPAGSHVPFTVIAETPLRLGLHVARSNPQWQTIDGASVTAIFQGPHAFVSASWYDDPARSVPTWDYAAVHCTGRARLTGPDGTDAILAALTAGFEGGAWSMEAARPEYVDALKKAIVGIEIDVQSMSGAKKFSQNRSRTEIERIISEFERSGEALAAEMRAFYRGTDLR